MEQQHSKGQWGSSFGFLMAAIGSAVGLGNLWGFPYKMGINGGFAFLLLYIILVIFVGFVICAGELALGRHSGKGVVGAYESIDKKYGFIGWFGWFSPLLILGFYSMLGGYCIKYALANLGDLFGAGWGVGDADSGRVLYRFLYGSAADRDLFGHLRPADHPHRARGRIRRHRKVHQDRHAGSLFHAAHRHHPQRDPAWRF